MFIARSPWVRMSKRQPPALPTAPRAPRGMPPALPRVDGIGHGFAPSPVTAGARPVGGFGAGLHSSRASAPAPAAGTDPVQRTSSAPSPGSVASAAAMSAMLRGGGPAASTASLPPGASYSSTAGTPSADGTARSPSALPFGASSYGRPLQDHSAALAPAQPHGLGHGAHTSLLESEAHACLRYERRWWRSTHHRSAVGSRHNCGAGAENRCLF